MRPRRRWRPRLLRIVVIDWAMTVTMLSASRITVSPMSTSMDFSTCNSLRGPLGFEASWESAL